MKAHWILLALFLAPLSLQAQLTVDWREDLSNDGSTNYIPIAVSPADEAMTLTLTDSLCRSGGYPCFDQVPFTGFVALKAHDGAGVQLLARTYYPTGIRSRRDIVLEPQSGFYWLAINDETFLPRQSRVMVLNRAGDEQANWVDPAPGKEMDALAAAGGGVVYASSYVPGTDKSVVLDKYSGAGVVAWSRSITTTAAYTSNGVAATADGGALIVTASPYSPEALAARYAADGSLQWSVTFTGQSYPYGTLQVAMDASDAAWVALAVSGTGRSECKLVRIDPAGAAAPVARWSADADGSGLGVVKVLADGDLLVGGLAGQHPYLAVLGSGGTLKDEWFGDTQPGLSNVMDAEQRQDGKLFVSVWTRVANPINSPAHRDMLLGMDLDGSGGGWIPGLLPSATPTATLTPSPVVTWTPPQSQTPTMTPTPSPEQTAAVDTPTATPTATSTPTPGPQAPSMTPTPTGTAAATEGPTPMDTPTALPADCGPSVEKVQVVPCPVLDLRGGRLKVRLGACLPERIHISIFTQGGTVVLDWYDDVQSLAEGWNNVALPAGQLSPGLYYFRVTAIKGDKSSAATNSCLVLR